MRPDAGCAFVWLHREAERTSDDLSACQDPLLRDVDPAALTYYLRRETVIPPDQHTGMARWRGALFATMLLNANCPAVYYGLPAAQGVEVGLKVEI